VERLDVEQPRLIAACRDRLPSGVTDLDPGGVSSGQVDPSWGLRVNAAVGRGGTA
jgi:hypothetical protein